ncbi:unnamed protein product [Rotaria magnacalcarata]|uniref:Uncharacterized protein n=1 Tax=Rotaria magnacalcarata TaxID=392030 RepID=A0A816TFX5_9BILA|nr:unnamed protein product [Rotaria magnacalcarata]CAF1582357.1 unnamed protein product [Rotaria magnacalcarata]CAF2059796.1 unnamed protein product [Rotaria magnacalcarata]CAF2096491.1 unnamed protein product [Rotaria magnacalcarata]CAF2108867.1 unnamed protein product [Rotaria magnacalcarata]
MTNNATVPTEEESDHMIIWLDDHIGDPEWCQQLKRAFSTQPDPKNPIPVKLWDKEFAEMLVSEGHMPVHFEGVRFLLSAFTNIASCIHCFYQNQHRRIFFITSGTLGKKTVPIILEKFKDTFIDPVTEEPYMFIYVFCQNIEYHRDWALEYRDYIQIFNFEADLLARMMRDIGDYFLTESKRLLDESPPNNPAAQHRLTWANELLQRYGQMEKVSMKTELDEINQLLEQVEEDSRSSSDEDD